MKTHHVAAAVLLFAGVAACSVPEPVRQTFDEYQRKIAKAPKSLAFQFRRRLLKDFEKYPQLTASMGELGTAVPGPPAPEDFPESVSIEKREGQLSTLRSETDRAEVATKLANEIRALPPSTEKIILADELCALSADGDIGNAALETVASTLAAALREVPVPLGTAYIHLAALARYRHVTPPGADPALEAADAVLKMEDAIRAEASFSLTALDGKTYSLEALRGHVVLVDFWATWCPPCRREIPEMVKVYQRFGAKGLIVLVVADEQREVVENFLSKESRTFPVLLDAGDKMKGAYLVEEIPHTLLFDRQGKLTAQSIGLSTERQLLEMCALAGLN